MKILAGFSQKSQEIDLELWGLFTILFSLSKIMQIFFLQNRKWRYKNDVVIS